MTASARSSITYNTCAVNCIVALSLLPIEASLSATEGLSLSRTEALSLSRTEALSLSPIAASSLSLREASS